MSVIMSTYDNAAYIEAAIASLIAQTYGNWELIVIDDCSTDGTAAILERLAESDDRISARRNETNQGYSRNRNLRDSDGSGQVRHLPRQRRRARADEPRAAGRVPRGEPRGGSRRHRLPVVRREPRQAQRPAVSADRCRDPEADPALLGVLHPEHDDARSPFSTIRSSTSTSIPPTTSTCRCASGSRESSRTSPSRCTGFARIPARRRRRRSARWRRRRSRCGGRPSASTATGRRRSTSAGTLPSGRRCTSCPDRGGSGSSTGCGRHDE